MDDDDRKRDAAARADFESLDQDQHGPPQPAPLAEILGVYDLPRLPWAPTPYDVTMLRGWRISPE